RYKFALHHRGAGHDGFEQPVEPIEDHQSAAKRTHADRESEIRGLYAAPVQRKSVRIIEDGSRQQVEQWKRWTAGKERIVQLPSEVADRDLQARRFQLPKLAVLPRRMKVLRHFGRELVFMT